MKIYIAGPIFGIPHRNERAFRTMAKAVENQLMCGTLIPHDIPPWEHTGSCPPGRRAEGETHNEACHLRNDIRELVECDGIALLTGWQSSHGARAELQVANTIRLPVYVQDVTGLLREIS